MTRGATSNRPQPLPWVNRMGKSRFSKVEAKQLVDFAREQGFPVEKMSLVVSVRGMGLLQPGEGAASLLGLEDGANEWDAVLRQ